MTAIEAWVKGVCLVGFLAVVACMYFIVARQRTKAAIARYRKNPMAPLPPKLNQMPVTTPVPAAKVAISREVEAVLKLLRDCQEEWRYYVSGITTKEVYIIYHPLTGVGIWVCNEQKGLKIGYYNDNSSDAYEVFNNGAWHPTEQEKAVLWPIIEDNYVRPHNASLGQNAVARQETTRKELLTRMNMYDKAR